jgi:hypothetical protein
VLVAINDRRKGSKLTSVTFLFFEDVQTDSALQKDAWVQILHGLSFVYVRVEYLTKTVYVVGSNALCYDEKKTKHSKVCFLMIGFK